ncbi:hypothetical protein AQF52_4380 [Streptomyces venezuelae]|nr:hypothetical protein AQF52_4380 [Streptomyces venezuelae]
MGRDPATESRSGWRADTARCGPGAALGVAPERPSEAFRSGPRRRSGNHSRNHSRIRPRGHLGDIAATAGAA